MSDINTILNACELVWRQQSMATNSITEMRSELESHLIDAQRAGKSAESVVGTDVNHFARSWAGAQPVRSMPASVAESQSKREKTADGARMRLFIAIGAIVLITILGLALSPKSDYEGLAGWQWVFVLSTFTLLVGEMLTASFFVLPFGIAAASGTLMSFAKVEPPFLISSFLIMSILGLWGLREFAAKDDDEVFPVGANRYVDQTGIVTEAINGVGSVGRVRLATESWMAIADGTQHIAEGTIVRIVEVRGARFVVTAS